MLMTYLCSDAHRKCSTECSNMILDKQMQYENSKDIRAGMCDDYKREKNLERKNVISVHKKVRSKINTEMEDHTSGSICKRTRGTKFWITFEKNNIKV